MNKTKACFYYEHIFIIKYFNNAHILFWLLKSHVVAFQPFLHINSTESKIYLVGNLIITIRIKTHILFDPVILLKTRHHTDIFP